MQMTAFYEEIFKQKGIDYEFNFPNDELITLGDYDRLTQVVLNILSNAIKFCNTEKGKVKVLLEKQGNKLICLKINDNGKGIKLENQQLIFDKFTQLSSRESGKPTGSGLGLFICKEILKQHNGEIAVESNAKKGTTFTVKIPLKV